MMEAFSCTIATLGSVFRELLLQVPGSVGFRNCIGFSRITAVLSSFICNPSDSGGPGRGQFCLLWAVLRENSVPTDFIGFSSS
jgi:hypothetical protein